MTRMLALLAGAALFALTRADAAQPLSVLHIKIVLSDAEGTRPVPRHALLISDNPATAAPRLVTTGLDGTADVKLRPGNYTVESDRPVAFHGKNYQWMQTVDVVAGHDLTLELTGDNAEIVPLASVGGSSNAPLENDPSLLLHQWQDSVVTLWTPYKRAVASAVDARGLLVTSRHAIGTATSVEVQLTPATKVEGRVLVSDAVRDVAVLWIDPKTLGSTGPIPIACGQPPPTFVVNQELFAIVILPDRRKEIASGAVRALQPGAVLSNFLLESGSAGGPVFSTSGEIVGITSTAEDTDPHTPGDVTIVRASDTCDAVAAAEKKMTGTAPPGSRSLPVEPTRQVRVDIPKGKGADAPVALTPYQISSSTFDVTFMTPALAAAARRSTQRAQPLLDFGNWSAYVETAPPVLMIRVTPKLVEGFWTMVARGAARTQGMAIPPIKRPKSGFSRLRAFCGDAEVTPIHPFKIEHRVSATATVDEGLYIFDPGALGRQCGSVKLVLYSDKAPEKGETRVVDEAVIQKVWDDLAPYRD